MLPLTHRADSKCCPAEPGLNQAGQLGCALPIRSSGRDGVLVRRESLGMSAPMPPSDLCKSVRCVAENTQAHHQRARKAHLPGRAQAAGRAECPRICRAEDQALSKKGVQSVVLSRPPSSDTKECKITQKSVGSWNSPRHLMQNKTVSLRSELVIAGRARAESATLNSPVALAEGHQELGGAGGCCLRAPLGLQVRPQHVHAHGSPAAGAHEGLAAICMPALGLL